MRDFLVLLVHLIVTMVRLAKQSGLLSVVKIRPTFKVRTLSSAWSRALRVVTPIVITMLRGNPNFLILRRDALERSFCGPQAPPDPDNTFELLHRIHQQTPSSYERIDRHTDPALGGGHSVIAL